MKEDPEETIRSTRGDENGASPKLTCDDVGTSVGICVALLGLSAGVVMYVVYVRRSSSWRTRSRLFFGFISVRCNNKHTAEPESLAD